MDTHRLALANLRFPASPEDSVTLAEQSIAQAYGKEGLLVADIDIAEATGLLARRCKYGEV